MKRANFKVGWICAAVGALMLLALTPGTTAAGARLTFSLQPGAGCVTGHAAPDSDATVTWKNAAGQILARETLHTQETNGFWVLCSDDAALRAGDTIKVRDELGARTLTMPLVTLILDRTTDVLRGRGPANAAGTVYWRAGLFADYDYAEEITSDSDGRWSFTPEEEDIIGGIEGAVDWTSPMGDTYYASGRAPFIQVTLGRAGLSAGASPGQSVLFKLRDPLTATLKGTAAVVADEYGSAFGQFVNSQGQPTPVLAGNRVLSTVASDLDWIVPNVEVTANVASDFVNGSCYSTDITPYFVQVEVFRTGVQRGFALGNVEGDGSFSIDFGEPPDMFYDPANIKHGDRIEVSCVYDTGDVVRLVHRVP